MLVTELPCWVSCHSHTFYIGCDLDTRYCIEIDKKFRPCRNLVLTNLYVCEVFVSFLLAVYKRG